MGGGRPGIERIGGIWVLLAPGRLNKPVKSNDERRRCGRHRTGHTGLFRLHGGICFVSRGVDIPTAGLPLSHRQRDRVCRSRAPSFRGAHAILSAFRAPSSIAVTAVTLWRAVNLHFVVAPWARSLLAFSSIPPSCLVLSRPPIVVTSVTVPVVSSVPVTSVVTIPVPVSIATVPSVIVSGRAVSVLVVPVVICKQKERRKGYAGKQNRIRRTRSVRLVMWGSAWVSWDGVRAFNSAFFLYNWSGLAVDARAS